MSERIGTLSDTVYKRSVEKNIKSSAYREAAICGLTVSAQAAGINAFPLAINKVLAVGGNVQSVSISVFLPPDFDEKNLKKTIKMLSNEANDIEVDVAGIDVRCISSLREVCINVFAIGVDEVSDSFFDKQKKIKTGDAIIITKSVGLGGIYHLIGNYRDEILRRYTESFYDGACEAVKDLYLFKEYGALKELISESDNHGIKCAAAAGEGGIFASLWNLAARIKRGYIIDSRLIPISQETVETSEMFNINPYNLDSTGSMLIVTEKPDILLEKLKQNGVNALCAGYVSDNNDKIIETSGRRRFLDKPAQDEIYSKYLP